MTQTTAAQLPDCDLTGSQSQPFSRASAQCVAHLGTPALQITVYTHDGESQAVLRRARQGRDAHPWWPRQLSGRRIGERADSLRPALGTSGMEGSFVTDRRVGAVWTRRRRACSFAEDPGHYDTSSPRAGRFLFFPYPPHTNSYGKKAQNSLLRKRGWNGEF